MWRGLRKVIYLVPSNTGGRVAVRHVTATHASEDGAESEAAEQEGKGPSQAAANALGGRSKVSLATTGEKDLESGSPATKGAAASGKTRTYSVELKKTPLGLGLSLADDIVTEIKPDSQAARGGRIKEGHRRLTLTLTRILTLITLTLTLTRWVIGSWP